MSPTFGKRSAMTHGELIREYERRLEDARRYGALAPLDKAIGAFLEDLRQLDGFANPERLMDSAEAAETLGLSQKTVRKWIKVGRFPGARKTNGEEGEWRIPAREVHAEAGNTKSQRTLSPKLWVPKGGAT